MNDYRRSKQKNDLTKDYISAKYGQSKTGRMAVRPTRLFLLLFFSIAIIPLFIHAQWITGTIVNAILIFTCLKIGFRSALFLAFIPSMAALSTGLLPLAISPIIPFIVTGNIILLLVFHLLPRLNFFIKLAVAAFLKFQFLYWSTYFLVQYFLPDMFIPSVMLMMGWHQFVTAMVGGIVAYSVMKGLSSNDNKHLR